MTFHRDHVWTLVASRLLPVNPLAFGRTELGLSGRRVAVRAGSMSMTTAAPSNPVTPTVQIRTWFALYPRAVITNIAELDAHKHIKVTTYAIDEIVGTEAR